MVCRLPKLLNKLRGNLIMFEKVNYLSILLQLSFGMLGALIVHGLFLSHQQQVATVNVTHLVQSFVKETAELEVTAEIKKQKTLQFGKSLNAAIEKVAQKRHVILVVSEAVVAGAPDLSDEVIKEVKKGIKS